MSRFWICPFVLTLLSLLAACAPTTIDEGGTLRHAQLLRMQEDGERTLVAVLNPWDSTATLARYALVPRTEDLPDSATLVQKGYQVLRTPLRRVLPTNAVHAALALDLQAEASLVGLCDTAWVVSTRLKAAALPSYGSSMQPEVERIVAQRVEAVLVSPFEGGRQGALEGLGVPLIECADYLEATPLGRAEWMRFYGLLLGQGARADSLFLAEEEAYTTLTQRVKKEIQAHPSLMVDRREGAAWYVPAGGSYLAQLYADAGARYLFAHLPGTGGTPLDLEQVLATAREADVWVVKYAAPTPLTRAQLAADHPLYTQFRPYRTQRMFGCNTLQLPYYEELPFRPSLLLNEWVQLLHPQWNNGQKNRYFTPLH